MNFDIIEKSNLVRHLNTLEPKEKALSIKELRELIVSVDNWYVGSKVSISPEIVKENFKIIDDYLKEEQFKLARKL